MSMIQQGTEASAGPSLRQIFHRQRAILIMMVMLSAVGIAVTDSFPTYGDTYWLAMGPIFCAINLYTSWSRRRERGQGGVTILWTVLLHWGAFLVAVYLVFLLLRAGRMNNEDAGLVALMALALTAFLAGVHYDWRFYPVGVLLFAIVAGGSFVERFLWMLLLPAAAVVILVVLWWPRQSRNAGNAAEVP